MRKNSIEVERPFINEIAIRYVKFKCIEDTRVPYSPLENIRDIWITQTYLDTIDEFLELAKLVVNDQSTITDKETLQTIKRYRMDIDKLAK